MGPEKCGHYAGGCLKKMSGKEGSGWFLWLQTGHCWQVAVIWRWSLEQVWLYIHFKLKSSLS